MHRELDWDLQYMENTPTLGNMSSEEEAAVVVVEMCTSWIFPAALRTIVQLDVPHILDVHATPPSMALTAEELLQHMEAACPNPRNLERLLRLLTTKGIFAEHMTSDDSARRFSLTRLSKCLVRGDGTYRDAALFFTLGPEYSATLEHLRDSILMSTNPFTSAHGVNQFEYMKTHPTFLETFKNAFKDMGSHILPRMLSQYHGFDSVHKLVDVGGSSGIILATIVERYPHIHGINFDLPRVVVTNPSFHGVQQVGGDMFEEVPSGCDAIFMKGILHDWSDKQCLKILTNCYNALPRKGGKLIMMDVIMPTYTPFEASIPIQRRIAFQMDIVMQIHCENGRERTAIELEGLLKQAGFNSLQILAEVGPYHVMEAHK